MPLTAADAENMVIRLTRLTLVDDAATKLLSDDTWREERVMDVIEHVNDCTGSDEEAAACTEVATALCTSLAALHPESVRPGFNPDAIEVESDDEE
jgi:hypothetical protein